MLFDVIGYNNEVLGQVTADNPSNAWDEARKKYKDILDIMKSTKQKSMFYDRELVRRVTTSQEIFYHVTNEINWPTIQKYGLLPMSLNKEIQESTGIPKGVFIGGIDTVEEMKQFFTLEQFENNESLKEVTLIILEVIVPENTLLIEDPEYVEIVGSEFKAGEGAWIISVDIPPVNIKYFSMKKVKREEWE